MSIVSSDIVVYGSANIQETDSGTVGGAINTAVRYIFDDAALVNDPTGSGGDGTLKATSDNAGDTTQTVTVTGRDAGGSIVTDTFALNGTAIITGGSSTVFERILKIVLSASAAGTVTISDSTGGAGIGNTIVQIETGVTTVRKPFYNVSSDVVGGSTRNFYEKVFIKNNNGVNSLLGMSVVESADPTTKVTFALEDAVDDNGTTTNRTTIPSGIGGSGFDSNDKTLSAEAGQADLAAGEAIGVWLNLTLAAGDSPTKSTWTMGITGQTT